LRRTPEKRAAVLDDIDSLHETATLAAYIGDLAGELADLAGRSKLPMLAYFLNLARVEAEIRARELGGCKIDRQS
jgi:hypothetical protein